MPFVNFHLETFQSSPNLVNYLQFSMLYSNFIELESN